MTNPTDKLLGKYAWLAKESAPRMLVEAVKLYGTREIVGSQHSPVIMGWAKELGLERQYTNDETAWCGLFTAVICQRAGKPVVKDPLWARNWLKWGVACQPELGCIMVFSRSGGGGHVAVYVGEDDRYYYVIGGNQSNTVNVMALAKDRFLGARCLYTVAKPANVRKVLLSSNGAEVSHNEA